MTPQAALFDGLQWALLHSLWEGGIIALLLALALRQLPVTLPKGRYRMSVAALGLFLFTFTLHWSYLAAQASQAELRFVLEGTVAASATPAEAISSDPSGPSLSAQALPMERVVTVSANAIESQRASAWGVPWLLTAWGVGVALMLLRLLAGMRGVRGLLRATTEVTDPVLLADFAALRETMAVRGQIALRASLDIVTPLAVGILWPTVILPASLLTGLSPAQLRAVLAHELAHIRRYDYLVNFLQRIAEAFFYFNPALWWISRQIRLEREACCDALAARHTGDPLDYAAALLAASRHTAPAMACANAMDGGDPGGVAERLRRLLITGHRPALRCPWYSFVGGLVAALLLGGGLYLGSYAAADVMVTYLRLNDSERVAYLREATKSQTERETGNLVTVTGKVLLPDDSAPDRRIHGTVLVRRDGGSSQYSYGTTVSKGKYKQDSVPGETYFFATSKEHAPGFVGPVNVGTDEVPEMPDLVLQPAIWHTIRVEDTEGNPVPNVTVRVSYRMPNNIGIASGLEYTTDIGGAITVSQGEPLLEMSVSLDVSGYEPVEYRPLHPVAGEVSVVRIRRDTPIRLRVTRGAGGPSAQKAACYLLKLGEEVQWDAPQVDGVEASDGTLALAGLKRDQDKDLLIRDPEYGSARVRIPAWETGPVDVALQEYHWAGKITGDLELLEEREGAPGFGVFHYVPVDHHQVTFARNYFIPVEIRDGVGHFRVNGMVPGQINLLLGGQEDTVRFESSRDVYSFMLVAGKDGKISPKVRRQSLSIALSTTSGSMLPACEISVELLGEHSDNVLLAIPALLEDGQAQIEIPLPARARINLDNLPGYQAMHWTLAGKQLASDAILTFKDETHPLALGGILAASGAIRSEVINSHDGKPIDYGHVVLKELVEEFPGTWKGHAGIDAQGIAWHKNVPLNRAYTLEFEPDGRTYTRTVRLTEAEPVAQVRIEVDIPAEGSSNSERKVPVSVTDQDGNALSDFRVLLQSEDKMSSVRHGVSGGTMLTLTSAERGVAYQGIIAFQSGYAPVPVTLGANDTEIRAQARPGRRGEGRVLLRGSNAPVAGVEVACLMPDFGDLSETTTDEQGHFVFSNLPDTPVTVSLRSLGGRSWYPDFGEPVPLKEDGSTVLYVEEGAAP